MAFRKQMALALAMAMLTFCFGCADELNAPITEDEAPLLAPTNVRALALSDGDVEVVWEASSQPNTNGYNLYRREVGTSSSRRLNSSRLLSTQYVDQTTVRAKNYEYRVTVVSTTGRESGFTAVVIQSRDVVEDGNGRVPNPGME